MCCLAFDVLRKLPGLSLILLRPLFVSGCHGSSLPLFPHTCSLPSLFLPSLSTHSLSTSPHDPFSRGLECLKASTPVAPTAAPTLLVWMAMNISSGVEKERICFLKKNHSKKMIKKVGEMSNNVRGEKVTEQ